MAISHYPGSYGVPGVKKSIFWLLLEIVLGWSEWPKNAQNGLKNRFYGSTMAPQGAQGCHLGTVSGHRTGNLVIFHSFANGYTRCTRRVPMQTRENKIEACNGVQNPCRTSNAVASSHTTQKH